MKVNSIIKVVLVAILISFSGCNKDEIKKATVNYANPDLEAVFYTEGSSEVPEVDWNGDQGQFTYSPPTEGLSIDPDTGQFTWDKMLQEGFVELEVQATNKKGTTTHVVRINNPFQGEFTGTYFGSYNFYFNLEFHPDGKIVVKVNDKEDPLVAEGTWEFDNGEILANFTFYDNGGSEYSIKCAYDRDEDDVFVNGELYQFFDALDNNFVSFFSTTIDD